MGKVTALPELLTPAAADVQHVVDVSDISANAAGTSKQARLDDILATRFLKANASGTSLVSQFPFIQDTKEFVVFDATQVANGVLAWDANDIELIINQLGVYDIRLTSQVLNDTTLGTTNCTVYTGMEKKEGAGAFASVPGILGAQGYPTHQGADEVHVVQIPPTHLYVTVNPTRIRFYMQKSESETIFWETRAVTAEIPTAVTSFSMTAERIGDLP